MIGLLQLLFYVSKWGNPDLFAHTMILLGAESFKRTHFLALWCHHLLSVKSIEKFRARIDCVGICKWKLDSVSERLPRNRHNLKSQIPRVWKGSLYSPCTCWHTCQHSQMPQGICTSLCAPHSSACGSPSQKSDGEQQDAAYLLSDWVLILAKSVMKILCVAYHEVLPIATTLAWNV